MQVSILISENSHYPPSTTHVTLPFPLLQMSCVEEEIDRMNESFLQLSVQLQKRAKMSTLLKERENSAGNHAVISLNITYIIT